jgi:hypothetical protein
VGLKSDFSPGTSFSETKAVDTKATLLYKLTELNKSVQRSFMRNSKKDWYEHRKRSKGADVCAKTADVCAKTVGSTP